jgi:hypothetical protein
MDVFFISYKEPNCEVNWIQVQHYHPDAKRIHGVDGIDRVHLACNHLSTTEFFWTVDGDNWLEKKLEYSGDLDVDLIMFKATDPIHHGPTLLGGVKLWRKDSIVNPNMSKGDFSLNATASKRVEEEIYSRTSYNRSPYDTWKTAFRHCVKLMSVIFRSRPNAKNLDAYIEQWASSRDSTEMNARWAYQGYQDAIEYVEVYDNNLLELNKINNYKWLAEHFKDLHGTPKTN